jgi:hypothetical protein
MQARIHNLQTINKIKQQKENRSGSIALAPRFMITNCLIGLGTFYKFKSAQQSIHYVISSSIHQVCLVHPHKNLDIGFGHI